MSRLIFITGGVRSGKSAFAERYASELYVQFNREQLYYIASGVPFDKEMSERIKRHQKDRVESGLQWKTIEIQDELKLDEIVHHEKSVILWDCLTSWLSNVLYKTEQLDDELRIPAIDNYLEQLKSQLFQWTAAGCIVLLVSNEVLDEPDSAFPEVNYYRLLLGKLHQWIVEHSDEAYEMDYSKIKQWK